jgi:hypothetical protein
LKISIEHYTGDSAIVNDKNYLINDVKEMYANCLCISEAKDVYKTMAKMYGFKIEPFNPAIRYDYYIDADIKGTYVYIYDYDY